MEKFIVRSEKAGVFYGEIESRKGDEVIMTGVIRLWRWAGARSLSQLAQEGTKSKDECCFAVPVSRIVVFGVIEILTTTSAAQKSIESVPPWKITK